MSCSSRTSSIPASRYFLNYLRKRGPASLRVCTLLDKRGAASWTTLDYIAFEVADEFVVGYGLDYRELYRNLPFICVLKRDVYETDAPLREPQNEASNSSGE